MKLLRHIRDRFSIWFKTFYREFFLSLFIVCLTFPKFDLLFASGIDESLPWVFNYLADGHYKAGEHILFPHGPFAFLMYPLPVGNNLAIRVLIQFVFGILLGLNLFVIQSLRNKKRLWLPCLFLWILLSLGDIQFLTISLCASYLLRFRLGKEGLHLMYCVFFSVFALFLRSYCGIICALLLAGQCIYTVCFGKNMRQGAQLIILYTLSYFALRLFVFGSLGGSTDFLLAQIELGADNSEAVLFEQSNTWWLIGFSLLMFFLTPVLTTHQDNRHFFWAMLLPLFGAWKHAMARECEASLMGFLNLLVLFYLLLWLIHQQNVAKIMVGGFLCTGAWFLHLSEHEDFGNYKRIQFFRPQNLVNVLFYSDSLKNLSLNFTTENLRWRNKFLPDSLLQRIGNTAVDVYPWNYAYIGGNRLNWQGHPVLQSYAGYTPWLDHKDAKHFASKNSAPFVIWELNDMDENGSCMDGIDRRYVLNDEPQTVLAFFSHYRLRSNGLGFLLYEKMPVPYKLSSHTISRAGPVQINEWIELPPFNKGIGRARVKIRKNLLGALKSIFYKGESFYMHCELGDSSLVSLRVVPKNMQDGIWLYPFVNHPDSREPEPQIKRIKFTCSDDRLIESEIGLEFEESLFTEDRNGKNALVNPWKFWSSKN